MRSAADWADRSLGPHAALVLGWRSGRHLRAGRLRLAQSMDQELRSRAQATLTLIGARSSRAYESSAQLEEDETFLLTVDQLPTRPTPRRRGGQRIEIPTADEDSHGDAEDDAEVSELITLLEDPASLGPLPTDDIRGRTFLFYAAVFSDRNQDPIAFINHHNPAGVLKSGRLFGLLGQTVTHVEQPVLVFEQGFDLVIDHDEVAAMRGSAIPRLFADVEVVAAAVPAHLAALGQLPLAVPQATLELIGASCTTRRLLARRLEDLLRQPHMETLTVDMVRKYLRNNNEDVARFIKNGQIVTSAENIPDLLDVLDQRHYLGGYDNLLRRADRASLLG